MGYRASARPYQVRSAEARPYIPVFFNPSIPYIDALLDYFKMHWVRH